MVDRGYDDRPVKELTDAELAEQALQSDYDSGYYAAKPGDHLYARLGQVAIDRRNERFAEIKRRLEAARALAEAMPGVKSMLEAFQAQLQQTEPDDVGHCPACGPEDYCYNHGLQLNLMHLIPDIDAALRQQEASDG